MRLAAAMIWYTQGRIRTRRPRSFAACGRIDFIDDSSASKLPAFHVDVDELMEEVGLAHQRIVNTSPRSSSSEPVSRRYSVREPVSESVGFLLHAPS